MPCEEHLLCRYLDFIGDVDIDLDVTFVVDAASKKEIEGKRGHNNNEYDCDRGHIAAVAVGHGLPPVSCCNASRLPGGRAGHPLVKMQSGHQFPVRGQ